MKTEFKDSDILTELRFLLEEENRVITYKFVAHNFDIPVNKAKEQLRALLDAVRVEGDSQEDVTATYFLSGSCQEDGFTTLKALVVAEHRLEAARRSLSCVTSEHVYSVQRHRVCDSAVLFGADLQEQRSDFVAYNSHGAITCKSAELIPQSERLKARRLTATSSAAEVTSASAAKQQQQQSAAAAAESACAAREADAPPSGPDAAVKQEPQAEPDRPKAPKHATIASMFSRAAAVEKRTAPPKKAAQSGMMASFLKKGAEQPAPEPVVKPPATGETKRSPGGGDDGAEAELGAPTVRFGAKKGAGRRTATAAAREKRASAAREKRAGSATGGGGKKRRRILALASDSSDSSGDDGVREESEPEQEPEQELDPAPVKRESDDETPPTGQSQGRAESRDRRRKLVSKTFTDEDGFMVTKKEYESCSESELGPEPADKPAATAPEVCADREAAAAPSAAVEPPKRKPVSPAKKKQPNIMNFFKKK